MCGLTVVLFDSMYTVSTVQYVSGKCRVTTLRSNNRCSKCTCSSGKKLFRKCVVAQAVAMYLHLARSHSCGREAASTYVLIV
jgi:hypothetical protein